MAFITSLLLQNFRNYEDACVSGMGDHFVVLYGDNGAGKTNILEAVSLLTPGRGLRGAKAPDLQNQSQKAPWVLSGKMTTRFGDIQIGTGMQVQRGKRVMRIDGDTVKSQADLAQYVTSIWLTPQMDGLFMAGASERRRFFDRLVTAFDPAHQGRLHRYENALRQRTKILSDEKTEPDPLWLDGLEKTISETGVAVSAARVDFIIRLNDVTKDLHDRHETGEFPQGHFYLKGDIENALEDKAALEVEDMFANTLRNRRLGDTALKSASFGSHKCDIEVIHLDKNMPASQCSTGEQKALLMGIILAHRHMLHRAKAQLPILLLDEVAAHFDVKRRASLFTFLDALGGQVWMTGTDQNLFDGVPETGSKFQISTGRIIS